MLLVETSKGVRTIALNRPEALNAFNQQMWVDLCRALVAARDDNNAKVLVVTGTGRAFSAGADLNEKGQKTENSDKPSAGVAQLVELIIDFPKPIIVAVNGLGVGIGATLCGLADITYMAESARLRCPFSSLGITVEGASSYAFSRLMGQQAANWFLLSAQWMSAAECKAANLVLDVFADSDFMEQVIERAELLAAMPLASLIETKSLLMAPHKKAMHEANRRETEGLAKLSGGPSNLEAIKAFQEKRPADFSAIEATF